MKIQALRLRRRKRSYSTAFTLLEVMIACFVFFTVAFSVLTLTTQGLVAAKSLRRQLADPGVVAAMLATNQVFELGGPYPVDLQELGDDFRDYTAEYTVEAYPTNTLVRVDILLISRASKQDQPQHITTFFQNTAAAGRPGGGLR